MIEKPKGKRISDYETDDGLYYLTQLYRDYGYTDKMTAEAIGISRMTLTNWKKKSQKINHAISIGKSYMDTQVENALLRQALKGNVQAQIYWLRNRKGDKWNRDIKNSDADSNTEAKISEFFDKLGSTIDELK